MFWKVEPSTKTLPPAMSVLFENDSTFTPEGATATPTAFAASAKTGPRMTMAPSSTACLAIAAEVAGSEPAL